MCARGRNDTLRCDSGGYGGGGARDGGYSGGGGVFSNFLEPKFDRGSYSLKACACCCTAWTEINVGRWRLRRRRRGRRSRPLLGQLRLALRSSPRLGSCYGWSVVVLFFTTSRPVPTAPQRRHPVPTRQLSPPAHALFPCPAPRAIGGFSPCGRAASSGDVTAVLPAPRPCACGGAEWSVLSCHKRAGRLLIFMVLIEGSEPLEKKILVSGAGDVGAAEKRLPLGPHRAGRWLLVTDWVLTCSASC